MKQVPCNEVPTGWQLESALPDGEYVQINYAGEKATANRLGLPLMNPFPWYCVKFTFRDGEAFESGFTTDPGNCITRYRVKKVFLVGLSDEQRSALYKKLLERDIELIAE